MITGDSRASFVLSNQDRMYSQRANFNVLWQQVSERVLPNYSDFIQKHVEGQKRTNRVFESTATLALEHFCAALESMLCPASSRWHKLRPADPSLQDDIEIQQYMDMVTDALFRARYAPSANFQSQIHESFCQIGAFGNGPMLIDDVVGYGLRYRALHLAETYGMENAAGVIDHVQREYQLTAQACVDAEKRGMFDVGALPQVIKDMADKEPGHHYTFIHAVYPNQERKIRAKDHTGMGFSSCLVSKDFRVTLKESGYTSQPMMIPRYRVAPKEVYGRGPCVDVLPDILMLQEMEKTNIRQRQRAMDPPWLTYEDMPAFDFRSNSLNPGTMSADGKPLMMALQSASNFDAGKEEMDQKRKIIERALLVDIFSILIQQPQMTATEVLQRAQEKGQLLAPIIGRIQSELFGPMITRELDILHRAGQLPPPPDKLRKLGNLDYEIVYESQIQVAQKQSKALAINLVLQQAAPLFQADPTVVKNINMQRTLRILADSNGAPAGMMNTDEEMQQTDAAAAEQQNMANLAQIAGPASAAIKNLAQAQQAGGAASPGNLMGAQQ